MKMTTYDLYKKKIQTAMELGFHRQSIVHELRNEMQSIEKRAIAKQAQLGLNKSPYPAREAMRLARECIAVIKRLINELTPKENLA